MFFVLHRCLKDCGQDAHRHVAQCDKSLQRGGVFGSPAQFNEVHRARRREQILQYIRDSVPAVDQAALREAIRNDLRDLGIVL